MSDVVTYLLMYLDQCLFLRSGYCPGWQGLPPCMMWQTHWLLIRTFNAEAILCLFRALRLESWGKWSGADLLLLCWASPWQGPLPPTPDSQGLWGFPQKDPPWLPEKDPSAASGGGWDPAASTDIKYVGRLDWLDKGLRHEEGGELSKWTLQGHCCPWDDWKFFSLRWILWASFSLCCQNLFSII